MTQDETCRAAAQELLPPARVSLVSGYTHSELRQGNIDVQRHVQMGLFDALDGRSLKKRINWGTTRNFLGDQPLPQPRPTCPLPARPRSARLSL